METVQGLRHGARASVTQSAARSLSALNYRPTTTPAIGPDGQARKRLRRSLPANSVAADSVPTDADVDAAADAASAPTAPRAAASHAAVPAAARVAAARGPLLSPGEKKRRQKLAKRQSACQRRQNPAARQREARRQRILRGMKNKDLTEAEAEANDDNMQEIKRRRLADGPRS